MSFAWDLQSKNYKDFYKVNEWIKHLDQSLDFLEEIIERFCCISFSSHTFVLYGWAIKGLFIILLIVI